MDPHSKTASRPATPLAGTAPGDSAPDEETDVAPVLDARGLPFRVRDADRYQVIAEHGRGGVGRVLRATDRDFGRDVALKELLARTPSSEARFVREAIITSRLEHPNVVPVHEAGRWPDGTPYYSMKLVSGRPLDELIDASGSFAERRGLLARVLAIADAVAYAHDRGVIHRDLKPSNVIVGDYGETIVVDWGLAKYVAEPGDVDRGDEEADGAAPEPAAVELTRAGTILGTPAYMAPEQAYAGDVTRRTDVYALGAILRDVLAGRVPRSDRAPLPRGTPDGEEPEPAPPPRAIDRSVPAALRSIAARAMAESPWDRYGSAKEFADDLRRFQAGERVAAHRYTPRERVGHWFSAHRRFAQGAGAVLIALLAASFWFLARESRLRADAEDARAAADVARRLAETERIRADRQTLALLEQQGRTELDAGHPFRAAPFLAEAYRRDRENLRIRWLLTDALRALDSMSVSIDVGRLWPADEVFTYTVSFSPDDAELTTGHDGAVAFWDAATGRFRRKVKPPCCSALVRRDPAGDRLLTFGNGGREAPVRIFAADSGRELAQVPAGADVDYAVWSRDGSAVASVKNGGQVDVWRARPVVERVFSLSGVPTPVFGSLALNGDGSLLAARGKAEVILAKPRTGAVRRLPVPNEDVQQLSFSADGRSLLTTMSDRSIRIWDVASGEQRDKLPSHTGPPTVVLFSPDGSMIATADTVSLHLWDAASALPLGHFDVDMMSAAFANRGPRLATTSLGGRIRVWDFPPDRWARPLPDHRGDVRVLYLGGGDRLITADAGADGGGRLRVWDASSGRVERSIALARDAKCDIAVTTDGDRVAVRGRDGRIRILDTRSGQVQLEIDATGPIIDLAFSADGRRLAALDRGVRVVVWSVEDGPAAGSVLSRPEMKEQAGQYGTVAFSPDGRHLLTIGEIAAGRVWDASTWQVVRELSGSQSMGAYSADGRRIVTGGGLNGSPRVWDPATGELIAELAVHDHSVQAIAVNRDGSLVATVDGAGRIRIWDAVTGAELRTVVGPSDAALPTADSSWRYSVDFGPDGKYLAASGTGHATIWNIELDDRSPEAVDQLVAARSPWQLVDGRLTPRRP